jgi:hypothetical protein
VTTHKPILFVGGHKRQAGKSKKLIGVWIIFIQKIHEIIGI